MSMNLTRLVTEGGENMRELPMPPFMYGVIALGLFALALAVTWAFRGTAAKYGGVHPTQAHGDEQAGRDRSSGSGHH